MDSRQTLKKSILGALEAATRVEAYDSDQNKRAKMSLPPSPDVTPAPDNEKIKADLIRIATEKHDEAQSEYQKLREEELDRIVKCNSDEYDEILGVNQDTKEENKDLIRTENWILLGCLLNPKIDDKYKEAFNKLQSAAEKVELDNVYIEIVEEWDTKDIIPINKATAGIETQKEIKRILACADDKYDDILGVEPSIKEDADRQTARETNWLTKGCQVHKEYCHFENAKKAFNKLQRAARNIEVDDAKISAVREWNGKDNLLLDAEEEDEESEDEEGDDDIQHRLSEMEFENPNDHTRQVYRSVTKYMKMLIANPSDKVAIKGIKDANDEIKEDPKLYHIPYTNFQRHYRIVLNGYKVLVDHSEEEYPEDKVPTDKLPPPKDGKESDMKLELERAKRDIPTARNLIKMLIKKGHYEEDWSIPDAEYYKKLLTPGTESSQNKKSETESSQNKRPETESSQDPVSSVIEFPDYGKDWPTHQYNDNSRIIGWRPIGKFGKQVCIERIENNRLIRRLAAASTCGAGLNTVNEYSKDGKKFSAGQNNWSKADEPDFVELLWVTQYVTKSSANDPVTYCCVEFKKKGIQILTASNFRRVLSHDKANLKIKEICDRDGIIVPWERGCLDDIGYSPAKIKNPDKRFAAVDEASRNKNGRYKRIILKEEMNTKKKKDKTANELPNPNMEERVVKLETAFESLIIILKRIEEGIPTKRTEN